MNLRRFTILAFGILGLAGCTDVQVDCENATFEMAYNDGTPFFTFNLPAVDGGEHKVRFIVDYLGEAADAHCDWDSNVGGMWEVEGEFTQITYGQVPEGAKVKFDASEVEDLDWTSELIDGRAYSASVWLKDGNRAYTGCASLEYIWVQGDPDSIIRCE